MTAVDPEAHVTAAEAPVPPIAPNIAANDAPRRQILLFMPTSL